MATSLQPDACLAQIAAGRVAPVYFVKGPDTEMKERIVSAIIETIEADLRDFNVQREHAVEAKSEQRKQLWALLDEARTMPMLAPRRVVVLMSAEKVLASLRDADGKTDELDALVEYLQKPEPLTSLVFVAEQAPDSRLKAVLAVEKHATVVDCDPLDNAADGAAWVKAAAARVGVRIDPAAVRLLAFLAGDDIDRLRAEFERVRLFVSDDGIITEAAVQEVAGVQTSQDTWALSNALAARDRATALRELALKLDAGEPPVMVLGQMAYFVRAKMGGRPVRPALDALLRTDLALKRTGGDPRVVLERLVVELCR